MWTLIIITSLTSQFHHDLNIWPTVANIASEAECNQLGKDIMADYMSFNPDVKYKLRCTKTK